jgi:hypothetical protein
MEWRPGCRGALCAQWSGFSGFLFLSGSGTATDR